MKLQIRRVTCAAFAILAGAACSAQIEPTWESLAANYHVPEWFVDGKLGVWMHWGISSSADENRPPDGSHYGRRMYGTEGYDSANEPDRQRVAALSEWHAKHYGHQSEFGYEDLINPCSTSGLRFGRF
jgi:alpha-L-fucosidase